MCGRFGLTNPSRLDLDRLLAEVNVHAVADDVPAEIVPRYNIAPSTRVLAAFEKRAKGDEPPVRGLATLKWGFVPHWAKEASIGNRLANARAETVASTPAFRDAWKGAQRCLVPADVFYEWSDVPSRCVSRGRSRCATGRRSASVGCGARGAGRRMRWTRWRRCTR
ncbi:MAG: SOS response-associated peptidase [Gemmatimonadaceae bacterium]|nr:SOS response-associated peptidase [Gemmatimonadaceae bacterium]